VQSFLHNVRSKTIAFLLVIKAICRIMPWGAVVKHDDLECQPVDELWELYEEVSAQLTSRLIEKRDLLEKRLRQLDGRFEAEMHRGKSQRRQYPKVSPKFRNPEEPSQTWTGRGKQPRWLAAQLRSGRRIEDFQIEHVS
jgi:DNA-binding protein H-NS